MNTQLYHTGVLALLISFANFFLFQNVTAQTNPGIQANLTVDGLNQFEHSVEPLVRAFLNGRTITLPPKSMSSWGVTVNLTNLNLYDVKFGSVDLSMQTNQGIVLTLEGLSAHFAYDLYYKIEFDWFSGNTHAVATIDKTDVVILFNIAAGSNGKPSITVQNLSLYLGYFNPGMTGIAEWIVNKTAPLIKAAVQDLVPSRVTPIINDEIAAALQNVTMQKYLDPWNKTMIDFGLMGDPVVKSSYTLINIKGLIAPVGSSCPIVATPMTPVANRAISIYIHSTLIDCLLYSFQTTGVMNEYAADLLKEYVPLDDRVSLILNFTQTNNTVDTIPSEVKAHLELNMGVDRNNASGQNRMITMDIQLRIAAQLGLTSQGPDDVSVIGNVKYLTTELNATYWSKHLPPDYVKEISETNFDQLSQQANSFIAENVLPKVNDQLAKGIELPQNVTRFFDNPELLIEEHYIYFGTDFKPPSDVHPELSNGPVPQHVYN